MIKYLLKYIRNSLNIYRSYLYDANMYIKHNYSSEISQQALEAEILRQTHVLEKGMSLSNPRPGFGQAKVKELFDYLNTFKARGYDISTSVPFQNAVQTLKEYMEFQENLGVRNEEINQKIVEFLRDLSMKLDCGIMHINYDSLRKDIESDYPTFVRSRHSCRQFSDGDITDAELKKVIELAQRAPSACNRQPCKVYYSKEKSVNKYLSDYIAGNTGFADEAKMYLVITSAISSFHNDYERNQLYLDAGIFTHSLVQALHYYGFASCILQNGEFVKKDKEMRRTLKVIPNNEKIIVFVAIGKYKKEFNVALSQRKSVDDVLKKI